MTLRQRVCDLMVRVHRISPELAAYHVREMSAADLAWRVQMYGRLGFAVDLGARPPEIRCTPKHAGRDGGTANLPSECDSVALPLKGAGGAGFYLAIDVCREAEKQVFSGGRRVQDM
jgi:hypothetical protein